MGAFIVNIYNNTNKIPIPGIDTLYKIVLKLKLFFLCPSYSPRSCVIGDRFDFFLSSKAGFKPDILS